MLNFNRRMHKIFRITICLLLIYLHQFGVSQDSTWVRIYGDSIHMTGRSIIETYDYGYLIGGYTNPPPGQGYVLNGIILKTDINGVELWRKTIGEPNDNGTGGINAKQTEDGGFILFGSTYKFGNNNVFLMKLNACGEKEWNKIFISSYHSQWAKKVEIMNDGSYLLLLSYWGNNLANERIWVFKVSASGDIIWKKVYANWNPSTNSEEGRDLNISLSNGILITGDYYESQPGIDSNWRFVRPMHILLDTTGNEIWHKLWGIDDFFIGRSYSSKIDQYNNIYSVGFNNSFDIDGKKPILLKSDWSGEQLYHKNLVDSKMGASTTIDILEDTILFIGATTKDFNDDEHVTVYKTDTLGNILIDIEVLQTITS